uniref:Tubulin epsilon and delta complex protein 2 n=1 Tax=Sphenodon punctatus TaxID=8508 RepID=A0A8D0H6L7_SPHPU
MLSQALEDCAEQKQQLEQKLRQSRALLGDWKEQAPTSPASENSTKCKETEPSPKELKELELLNKALKKASRVRTSILQAPSEAAEGEKAANKKPASSLALIQQVAKPKESTSKTIKMTSGSKKPTFSKKPSAYMLKAPYKTDPEVGRNQVRASARQSPRTSNVSGKGSAKGAAPHQVSKHITTAKVGQEEIPAAAESRKPFSSPKSMQHEKQNASCKDSAQGKDSIATNPKVVDPEHDLLVPSVEAPVTSSHTAGDSPGVSAMLRTCTLQEKGSLLMLPLSYRKVYSRNSRLWEKCCLRHISPAAAAARNHFIEKMQATFCSSTAPFSPAEVEEEVTLLQDAYSLLSQCMEAQSAGNMTWEKEYEGFLIMEGLQAIASQCLHKLQLLREAMVSQTRLCPADCSWSKEHPPADGCPYRRQMCGDALATPLLFYSSFQELKDMEALKLQVAMLHQQIDIQKAMAAELLPMLESRLSQDGALPLLYRAVYTQLCEAGEHFPVLVNDELPD